MGIWIAAAAVLGILVATLLITQASRGLEQKASVPVPRSPLDYAERILASRYARNEISADEYGRMLVVLRR
jgi:uncharacterized membrane protein